MEIRNSIIAGAASVHRTLAEEEINSIINKVRNSNFQNLESYAWTSGRNKAISIIRHEKAISKMAVRAIAEEKRKQIEAEENRVRAAEIQAARDEFDTVLPTLLQALSGRKSRTLICGVNILRCVLARDVRGMENIRALFSSPDLFYQARRRALVFSRTFLSEKTQKVLEELKGPNTA